MRSTAEAGVLFSQNVRPDAVRVPASRALSGFQGLSTLYPLSHMASR